MSLLSAQTPPNVGPTARRPRLLAMEIEVRGHHAMWVRNLALAWQEFGMPADVTFLVTPKFFEIHADVVQYVRDRTEFGVSIESITEEEARRMERSRFTRYFLAWDYFCDYAERLDADRGLLIYFDMFQLPMTLGRRSPCPVTGIYFRPTFHYGHTLANYTPSWFEWFKGFRKRALLGRVLRNPMFERLFCLDHFAAEFINERMPSKTIVAPLADAYFETESRPDRVAALRASLEIESGRLICCSLGVMDRRKGIVELLEAMPLLSQEAAARLCLLLVGYMDAGYAAQVLPVLERIKGECGVQIVLRNTFVAEQEFQDYFDLSDVQLATYQRHMGSSQMLIRSARDGKPVLASDYGMMGEIVQRYALGLTCDTSRPESLAAGFEALLAADFDTLVDRQRARHFFEQNTRLAQAGQIREMLAQPTKVGAP